MFGWVQNSDNLDLLMITKVSSTYLFHKGRGSANVFKARFSTPSKTRLETVDETGELIAVPKACL